MEETFTQINSMAGGSMPSVNVRITEGGSIVGNGLTVSGGAIQAGGRSLDNILRSFDGGVRGGMATPGAKAAVVVGKVSELGNRLSSQLSAKVEALAHQVNAADTIAAKAHSASDAVRLSHPETANAIIEVANHFMKASTHMRRAAEKTLHESKVHANEFLSRNDQFSRAIRSLSARPSDSSQAGMFSLSFSSVNELKKVADQASAALSSVGLAKQEFFDDAIAQLDQDLNAVIPKDIDSKEVHDFMKEWGVFTTAYGTPSQNALAAASMNGGSDAMEGGDMAISGQPVAKRLAQRLNESRETLRKMINAFISDFGNHVNGLVSASDDMSKAMGKAIEFDDDTALFLETYDRMSEYLNDNTAKIYQVLLDLRIDDVGAQEVKARFMSHVRDLSTRASSLQSHKSTKEFAAHCQGILASIDKHSDIIKAHRDNVKKQGGATESTDEMFSLDTSAINVSGLVNPLDNLRTSISKIQFFRNVALFRSNLSKTSHELAIYSKDYKKSVGKAIGEAIARIKTEYDAVIAQVEDNKAGMGLEIDMYNQSRSTEEGKISKTKLKQMYKWQADARIGLYKTVEAVDLYLLHFTEAMVKNPDAVSDLNKLLSATKIIAKWYDNKAGDNLVRMFESFRPAADVADGKLDVNSFMTDYSSSEIFADLEQKLGGERAEKLYDRTRRAVEGVVVLKNIISYFITISERYGELKSEKNIYMAPSSIYKNLVNYIWVSALDVNTAGTEVLTDDNEVKRMLTFEDTKVKIASANSIDPETMGINFSRYTIDKLRILKSHNELRTLKANTAMMGPEDFSRVKQFVSAAFARLGKTDYIFEMMGLGVYDLSMMDRDMVLRFSKFIRSKYTGSRSGNRIYSFRFDFDETASTEYGVQNVDMELGAEGTNDIDEKIADSVSKIPNEKRSELISITVVYSVQDRRSRTTPFLSLRTFMSLSKFNDGPFIGLNGIAQSDTVGAPNSTTSFNSGGFLSGFLVALTGTNSEVNTISYAARMMAVLHYCIMQMLNKYKRDHSSSVFAIDDTYFVLTIKAIAGKVLAVTGITGLLKRPNEYKSSIVRNPTRLIMGGASTGNAEIVDEAVELYVRLPLLVEFYRSIFDNGNKEFKQDEFQTAPDEERISYVPEIGGIWTGLITTIFDKSTHIDAGLYTRDNMSRIVDEVNKIYRHYKASAPAGQLTRHVMLQLVAEINRRYGIIKREELQQYYRAVNASNRDVYSIEESNYTNNDVDILGEDLEFTEKSPSDEFLKFQKDIKGPSTSVDTKINKITDYKILKEFRERVQSTMNDAVEQSIQGDNKFLSMEKRIRMLKRAISTKTSRDDKYAMIIKAIDESDTLNQTTNAIFMCFHELALTPLRMVAKMHHALDQFLLTVFTLIAGAANSKYVGLDEDPVFKTMVDSDGGRVEFIKKINKECAERISELQFDDQSLRIAGIRGALRFERSDVPGVGTVVDGGQIPLALVNALSQFSTNAGDLVKMDISATNQIRLDLSEFQKVCSQLLSSVKFMVDKFTGLVPQKMLDRITKPERKDSVFWLEDRLINGVFNKLSKSESKRTTLCLDNLDKIIGPLSRCMFTHGVPASKLISVFAIHRSSNLPLPPPMTVSKVLPVIKDAFTEYDTSAKTYVAQESQSTVAQLLFNPAADATLMPDAQPVFGIVQEFNILLSQYMNDMYDSQSKKMYTKAFASFAGSALIDAMNGQSFPDFFQGSAQAFYNAPRDQRILSSTLAYTLKTMMNRTNPITNAKLHDVESLMDVSPHVLEKYRSLIPMYLRTFNAFLRRCRVYRKIIARMNVTEDALTGLAIVPDDDLTKLTVIRENKSDSSSPFAMPMQSLLTEESVGAVKETVALYIDEIVNGVSSIISDIETVHKELLETDSTNPLYFDVKKDFTKNYFTSSKELPFAPLSILTMGLRAENGAVPLHNRADNINNKFLYGLRSLLVNEFDISTTKIPYMKKLISDFNGYSSKSNSISETRFNEVLGQVGRATNFMYDLRFFNGMAISHYDPLENDNSVQDDTAALLTFQEDKGTSKANSMTLIESVNVEDSHIKVGSYLEETIGAKIQELPSGAIANAPPMFGTNPRARVIMINIVDMNIMPVNVHSLMREIPLANIYNYAMTLDAMVDSMSEKQGMTPAVKALVKNPYIPITATASRSGSGDPVVVKLSVGEENLDAATLGDKSLRFISDILISKLMKANDKSEFNSGVKNSRKTLERLNQRTGSKIFHNLAFLTLIQYTIKQKVKNELEFINTRVVTSTNAVNDIITNARTDAGDAVTDDLFQF